MKIEFNKETNQYTLSEVTSEEYSILASGTWLIAAEAGGIRVDIPRRDCAKRLDSMMLEGWEKNS